MHRSLDPHPEAPFDAVTLAHGAPLPNRLMLVPLTNCQSGDDGRLREDELRWLLARARGGFALTSTCAAGSRGIVQLHHAGMRAPPALIGTQPRCPSPDAASGARGLDHRVPAPAPGFRRPVVAP